MIGSDKLLPTGKSINVQSDSHKSATVTTAITSLIMSQVPLGVGSNPVKQTLVMKTVLQEVSGCMHKETSPTGKRGVCDIPDMGVDNGHTMLKVSSQSHCRENRRYGSPDVLHCENQQDMVPGYGYQFYGSPDGPRWKDRHYGSPSVPQ